MAVSTQTHHIETQNADGTQYQVSFRWIEKLEWAVSITNVETQQQDHGIFRKQEDGLFAIDGLEDGPEVGFPSDHIQMIQNEICQDLTNHGELNQIEIRTYKVTTNRSNAGEIASAYAAVEGRSWRNVDGVFYLTCKSWLDRGTDFDELENAFGNDDRVLEFEVVE